MLFMTGLLRHVRLGTSFDLLCLNKSLSHENVDAIFLKRNNVKFQQQRDDVPAEFNWGQVTKLEKSICFMFLFSFFDLDCSQNTKVVY